MKKIWIFAERQLDVIHSCFYELLGKAKELYPDGEMTALYFDGNERCLEELKRSGVNRIILAKHPKLEEYEPEYFAEAMADAVKKEQPDILLIGATAIGSELAPTVAAKCETGLAAHCADLCTDENGGLVTLIPAFGGKLLGEIMIPDTLPAMASVKPGIFERKEIKIPDSVEMECMDTAFLDHLDSHITLIGLENEVHQGENIENAEVILCAGLGIQSKENWEKAQKLAKALKGVLGYTRPAVDMGYVSNEDHMIGTSGKMVHPKLYISIGVSGAAHHTCGMRGSQVVISVNSDPTAEIFKVSDYKLVGDSTAVLEELLKCL